MFKDVKWYLIIIARHMSLFTGECEHLSVDLFAFGAFLLYMADSSAYCFDWAAYLFFNDLEEFFYIF